MTFKRQNIFVMEAYAETMALVLTRKINSENRNEKEKLINTCVKAAF